MPEAFIYDHVRTPRGRGKQDGALHEVTALALATAPLKALKERNNLKEDVVDDVVLGVVDPVGEAGSDIARFAAIKAGLGEAVPGVQISRFCASGLDAVNFAAAQIMSGQHELTIGGGAESMSRGGIGASGGAWPMDPSMAVPAYFMPQRSEEHTSELQSPDHLVCRLLLQKKKKCNPRIPVISITNDT